MRHQDLLINHILESWIYTNAAARIAATGFAPADVGRIAFQQDNNSYWRLINSAGGSSGWFPFQNNIVESFSYANTAARTGATGFVPGDVGRVAYQIDTGQYWRLLSQSGGIPTWLLISPNAVNTWTYATAADRNAATGFGTYDVGRLAFQSDTARYWLLASQTAGVPTWRPIAYLENWVYANAAARTGATGVSATEVGMIAYQTDTSTYWRLLSQSGGIPTWVSFAGNASAFATLQTAQVTPTGTVVTTGVMAGLGTVTWGTALITPNVSGTIFVTIAGSLNNSTTGGVQAAIHWGTGAAPSNGAVGTAGTTVGGVVTRGAIGTGLATPFSLSAVITGLTLGQTVWLDLGFLAVTTGTATVVNVAVSAFEVS